MFVCLFFSLQESILTQVQRVIKGEVSLAMKEQQAAVTSSIVQAMRSAAGTPIPSTHLDFQSQQTHIIQLLQQGHLNQAFQQVRGLPCAGQHCFLEDRVRGNQLLKVEGIRAEKTCSSKQLRGIVCTHTGQARAMHIL